MKTKMIATALCLLSLTGMKAQEADQQIGGLLSQNDWFALDEAYPKVKEQIQTPIIKGLSEVMLAAYFNRPERAVVLIDSLIVNCQDQMGFDNTINMVLLKSVLLGEQGKFAESADNVNGFLDQVTAFARKEDFPAHMALGALYGAMRTLPVPEVVRPAKDTEIPVRFEKAGKGELMFVPVTVGGKERQFIFDTGASSSFVSERFAKEIGLQVAQDSVMITGVESRMGQYGTTDKLIVGDIEFRNPLIYIGPPDLTVDTIYQIDAVLGSDFIKLVGETRIFPAAGKIIFPQDQKPLPATGRNMLFAKQQPYLKTFSNGERLIFHLDTGNAKTGLSALYYQKHKADIEAKGTSETIRGGGFGGIFEVPGYRLPAIDLTVGSVRTKLSDITVATQSADAMQRQEDGSLGADFVKQFREVVINFDKMFVEVAK